MNIRLVTYNIRLGIQQGPEAIADVLRAEQPDIVALQEVGCGWTMGPAGDTAAELAELLNFDAHVHVPALVQGDAQYGHALLSKWPIVSTSIVELTQDIDEPRALLESVIETPEGKVRVLSTHLSHIADRPPQGEQLLDALRERDDLPTVVMGDLNATREEPFLRALLDLCEDADPQDRPTFPAAAPERRIDYVLAREGTLVDTRVGEDREASDHRYVASTWRIG